MSCSALAPLGTQNQKPRQKSLIHINWEVLSTGKSPPESVVQLSPLPDTACREWSLASSPSDTVKTDSSLVRSASTSKKTQEFSAGTGVCPFSPLCTRTLFTLGPKLWGGCNLPFSASRSAPSLPSSPTCEGTQKKVAFY